MADLFEAFLSSGGTEDAFSKLTNHLAPLVYSSALRRTGDPQLAEDISQRVFVILARKAPSLRQHPSILGWVFQTTRLESAKAMRTERRRQIAHASFAKQSFIWDFGKTFAPDEIAAWRDALPHLDQAVDRLTDQERQLVLERFYHHRSFSEIASHTESTEAACKMRLKRALEKLSKVLRKRGITLSATTIASGLGAELARAAPKTLTLTGTNALAASTSLSGVFTLSSTR